MNKVQLEKFARLLLIKGVNIQKGQTLMVQASMDSRDLAIEVSKQAFEYGAKDVVIQWDEPELTKLRAKYCDVETLREVKPYQIDELEDVFSNNCVQLCLSATYPKLFDEVESNKSFAISSAKNDLRNIARKHIRNGMPWCGTATPSIEWANVVYPELPDQQALEALEDSLCKMLRINDDLDPIVEWDKHIEKLNKLSKWLNNLNLKTLHIKSELGTDLTLDLVENHLWVSAGEMGDNQSIPYIANIPTEEIFTDPHRLSTNGIAYASKPLIMNGKIVDNFSITFKDGKAIDCSASSNIDALKETINSDDNSCYLGEVALVSKTSPITMMNRVFYNGLIDENAACHLALGNSFNYCIKGGSKMTNEELLTKGVNSSKVHCDFMVGTPKLSVVGTTYSGEEITIMDDGDFVDIK